MIETCYVPQPCKGFGTTTSYIHNHQGQILVPAQIKLSNSAEYIASAAVQCEEMSEYGETAIWFRTDLVADWNEDWEDHILAWGDVRELDGLIVEWVLKQNRTYRFPGMDADARGGLIPKQAFTRDRYLRYRRLHQRLRLHGHYPLTYRTHELVLHPSRSLKSIAFLLLHLLSTGGFTHANTIVLSGQKPLWSYNGTVDFTLEQRQKATIDLMMVLLYHHPEKRIVVIDPDLDEYAEDMDGRVFRHTSQP